MEDIKVGEYVRLRNGIIDKIKEIKCVSTKMNNEHLYAFNLEKYPHIYREKWLIEKHSANIIDLIEVGDYVNGVMVYEILKDGRIHLLTGYLLTNEDIEIIATKEQFKNVSYEV